MKCCLWHILEQPFRILVYPFQTTWPHSLKGLLLGLLIFLCYDLLTRGFGCCFPDEKFLVFNLRITGLSWFFFSLQIKAFFRNKSLFRNFFSGPLNIQSGLYMTLNRWKKLWFIVWLFTSWSNKRHEIWICNRCRLIFFLYTTSTSL